MGLVEAAFNPRPNASVTWSPMDDRWYSDLAADIYEGKEGNLVLSAESILNCGTVFAAVAFRAASWAMCPPSTIRKQGDLRIEDPGHYSQRVLRNPNAWMTGNRWRNLNGVWMATWGNGYNEIIPGRDSFAQELRPLHPSVTSVADQRDDGTLIYRHRPHKGPERLLGQERVLHFRDLSTDGVRGVAIYQLIRNLVTIALLAERHAMTFLRKGARISGLIMPSERLEEKDRKELKDSINATLGGPGNTGMFGIAPFGVELKPISNTMRESQFAEIGDQVVGGLLRFLGVPGVVVGYMGDKTATYASAKEFFESGGIKHCVLPILSNIEEEEGKALLLEDEDRQIKHNLDVLLRANTKDRFESLFKAVGGPWMAVNEARRIEDMNPSTDPRHDRILTPQNMTTDPDAEEEPQAPAPPTRRPPPPPPDDDEEDDEPAGLVDGAPVRALRLANLAAARIVRREVAAVMRMAPRHARPEAWRAWVADYYAKHVLHVQTSLDLSPSVAGAYCERQRDELLEHGAGVVETWEADVTPRLAALALGEA